MYLKIEGLTKEEYTKICTLFRERVKAVSIYSEVCKIEADCSIERVIDELGITISEEDYNKAVEEIAEELGYACEDNAFQEMCERADEIAQRYFATV